MSMRMFSRAGVAVLVVATLLGATSPPAAAQSGASVSGTVVEEGNLRPLQGVQVFVPGTRIGAVTGPAGQYVLRDLPAGPQQVQARLVGYKPQVQTVAATAGEQATLNFTMERAPLQLDQVVVTGTAGAQRAREVGNSISTINASEEVKFAPVNTVSELINGRAPGVIITPGTGMLGSGPKTRIRGLSSISLSSEPLVYVDGVRVNNATATGISVEAFGSGVISRLNDFNPQDIERIEIIKGAAAATLYGTEAASGVIQIITKKGAGGDARWGVTVRQGALAFRDPEGRFPTNYALINGEVVELDLYDKEKAEGRPIFRTGHQQEYGIDVTGGAQGVRYYAAGSLTRNEGIEPTNHLSNFTGRTNLAIMPNDKVDLALNLNYVTGKTSLTRQGGAGGMVWSTLFADPRRLNDPRRGFYDRPSEIEWSWYQITDEINRFTGSVSVDHRPLSWFSHRLVVGTDVTAQQDIELIPRMEGDLLNFFSGQITLGQKFISRSRALYNTFDYGATIAHDLPRELSSRTSVGAQYYRKMTEFQTALGLGFPAPGVSTTGSAATTSGNDDIVENSTVGMFVQQQIGWRDRVFVTAAVRADDNSAFGENFDFIYYPKFSASWILSEEPFFTLPLVSALKLRAAFGASGRQPDAFAALRSYQPVTAFGDSPGVTPQFFGNPDIGPERAQEVEVGFDLGLLDDRLGVDFTFYSSRTKDAILLKETAPSTGFPGAQFVNIGELSNRGIEMAVDALVIDRPNLGWDIGFSVATNRNRIESLGGLPPIDFGRWRHEEGYPIASFFFQRIVSADFNSTTGRVENLMCDGGPDVNHQPVPCAQAPRVFFGQTTPKVEGAVRTAVTFLERWRLSALVDFKTGHLLHDNNLRIRCQLFSLCLENIYPERYDPVWIAYVQNPPPSSFQGGYAKKADFAKLREVSLSYAVPSRLVSAVGASGASVTIAGRNLHTWTGYTGLDPENTFSNLSGNPNTPLEQAQLPQLMQWVATFRLDF